MGCDGRCPHRRSRRWTRDLARSMKSPGCDLDVRPPEVVPLEQQRLASEPCRGIAGAVAEIQRCRMATLAKAQPALERGALMVWFEGQHGRVEAAQQRVQLAVRVESEPRGEDDGRRRSKTTASCSEMANTRPDASARLAVHRPAHRRGVRRRRRQPEHRRISRCGRCVAFLGEGGLAEWLSAHRCGASRRRECRDQRRKGRDLPTTWSGARLIWSTRTTHIYGSRCLGAWHGPEDVR